MTPAPDTTPSSKREEVWTSSGTRMAELLELMVLKAITSATIGPTGPQQWKMLATPEDTMKLFAGLGKALTFDTLVQDSLPVEEAFLRHLTRKTTFHDATIELAGRMFAFRVILNWSTQTAEVTAVSPVHPAFRDR